MEVIQECTNGGNTDGIKPLIDAASIGVPRSPERTARWRQEFENPSLVIARLPPDCRRAFELHKLRGLSLREVTNEMGVPQTTIVRQLSKALTHIISEM